MKAISHFIFAGLLAIPTWASAGIAIIAHPGTAATALTPEQVAQLYMGRVKTLPGVGDTQMLDLPEGSPVRIEFAERVMGKTEQQLRTYWSRMIFTGKGYPPRALASPADVLRTVASTPGAIGFVDSKDVTPRVKVLYRYE